MRRHTTIATAFTLLAGLGLQAAPALAQMPKALSDSIPGSSATQSPLGGLSSGLSVPSIGSGNAGSAAGVLQYCVQNNYLSESAASSVKDKLLQKAGSSTSGSDYQQGTSGVLSGSNGQSLSLSSLKGRAAKVACDHVLSNAKSFL